MEKPTVFMIKADFGRTWQDGYWLIVRITVIKEVSPHHISALAGQGLQKLLCLEIIGTGQRGNNHRHSFATVFSN